MTIARTSSRGFTLTELLVVITIIAMIVALILVGFRKVKSLARVAGCLSNQRQIALAQSSYGTDNGGAFTSPCTSFRGAMGAFTLSSACGSFPIVLNGGKLTNESYHSWTASYPGVDATGEQHLVGGGESASALKDGRLFPYVGSVPVYRSPLDPTTRLRSYSLNAFVGVTVPNDFANYGRAWIDWYCSQGVTPKTWKSTHLAHIRAPSSTIMSIVEHEGGSEGFNPHGWVIDPRPPAGSVAPNGTLNAAAGAVADWYGWIDAPAMWNPSGVTYSNVDGSTESYSFQSSAAVATMQQMQESSSPLVYVQPPDSGGDALRRDWMHFRDRLLPGVIPPMIPRYQQ